MNPSLVAECLCEEDRAPEPDYHAMYEECVRSHQRQNAVADGALDLLLEVQQYFREAGGGPPALIAEIDRFLDE
jgi:hypothetical protein